MHEQPLSREPTHEPREVQCRRTPINWIGAVAEWTPDYTSPERQAVTAGLLARGGGVALSIEYALANLPVPAGSA